jgi:hypothetical protein
MLSENYLFFLKHASLASVVSIVECSSCVMQCLGWEFPVDDDIETLKLFIFKRKVRTLNSEFSF